jgi:lipopolysaccharide transport system ATP-binding protein
VAVPGEVESGAPLGVAIDVASQVDHEIVDPIATVTVARAADGFVCCDLSTEGAGVQLGRVGSEGLRVSLGFERLELAPGDYLVDVGIHSPDWEYAYDFHWQAYPLRVHGRSAGEGLLRPAHRWEAGPLEASNATGESAAVR